MRSRMLVVSIAIHLLAGLSASAAVTGRIEGRVARADGTGLVAVEVVVEGTGLRTVTEANGRFVIAGVPAGTCSLVFALGADTARRDAVSVAPGATTRVDQALDWAPLLVETVTVRAPSRRAERITNAPAAVSVVTGQRIAREEAALNVNRLLDTEPGIEPIAAGSYWTIINARGFNNGLNRRVLVLIDGRDIRAPLLRLPEWGTSPIVFDDLDDVEMVRGPTSALYGADAFNGVLSFRTRAPRDSLGGIARVTGGEHDLLVGEFRHAAALGSDWYMKLTGMYREGDPYSVSRDTGVEYSRPCAQLGEKDCLPLDALPLLHDDSQQLGVDLRFDKHFGSGTVLSLEAARGGYEGADAAVLPTGRWQTDHSWRNWVRVSLGSDHWNALAYYTRRDLEGVTLSSGQRSYDNSHWYHGEVQGHTSFAGGKGFVVGGASGRLESIDTLPPGGTTGSFAYANAEEHQTSLFSQADYQLTERLKATASLRWDRGTFHDDELSPRASLVYALRPAHSVRLSLSRGFKAPNYVEIYIWAEVAPPVDLSPFEAFCAPYGVACGFDRPVEVRAVPNESLQSEHIESVELGWRGVLGRRVTVSLDLYRSKITDLLSDLIPMINGRLGWISTTYLPYVPPADLPPDAAAALLAALQANLPPEGFAVLSNHTDGRPLFAAYSGTNFGEADTWGAELGLGLPLGARWNLDLSYTYFDYDVVDQLAEDPVVPNAAGHRGSVSLSYRAGPFDASLQYRRAAGYEWREGLFWGHVPAHDLATLSAGYALPHGWAIGLDVDNLFDDRHYEQFGADLLYRRAAMHVARSW